MRKLLFLALTAALLLGLGACGSGEDNPMTVPDTTNVQTTIATPEATIQVVEAIIDPDFDAEALFQRLEGYWNTEIEEEGYTLRWFVRFHYNEYNDAKPSLYCGAWESEGSDTGELVGGRSTGENTAELAFLFPAITGDGELPMHPELTAVVSLDFSALDCDGEIAIKINNYSVLGNGAWHTYTYGGKTMQEAAASSAQTLAPAPKSAQTQPKQSAAQTSTTTPSPVSYNSIHGDWPQYKNASEVVGKADLVFEGKVTGISFQVLDMRTSLPPTRDTEEWNRSIYTIYDVEITTVYKGNEQRTIQVRMDGGLREYRVNDQLKALGADASKGIPVVEGMPVLAIGKTYLFAVSKIAGLPAFILNTNQSVYDLANPSAKQSNVSVNDVIAIFG